MTKLKIMVMISMVKKYRRVGKIKEKHGLDGNVLGAPNKKCFALRITQYSKIRTRKYARRYFTARVHGNTVLGLKL